MSPAKKPNGSNSDIQNLLDATRISSDGVRPKFEWSEPADIVNAASEHRRRRLHGRNVNVRLAPDLPLIYVDSVLIEQAPDPGARQCNQIFARRNHHRR